MNKGILGAAMLAIATVAAAPADAVVVRYNLLDHIDGAISPPPYGLRMDGLYRNGQHTFSFDHPNSALFMDVDVDPFSPTVRIHGIIHGGKDSGAGYTYSTDWEVDFTYSSGVSISGTPGDDSDPLVVSVTGTMKSTEHGSGFIKALGNAGGVVQIDDVFNLVGQSDDTGLYFKYAKDEHRLNCPADGAICDRWVGRGWLSILSASGTDTGNETSFRKANGTPKFKNDGQTQDWLFTGDTETTIAEPVTLALFGLGLVGLGAIRRRVA